MTDLLGNLMDELDIGIVIIDNDMNIVHWNQWMIKKTNAKKEDAIGKTIFLYAPKLNENPYRKIINEVFNTGSSRFLSGAIHKYFFQNNLENQNNIIMENLQISKLKEENLLLIQVTDVSSQYKKVQKMKNFIQNLEIEKIEIKRSEEKNKQMALHDSLTGLPNRKYTMEKLENWIEAARNYSKKLAICFIDVDYLKNINDKYGHQFGDDVLKEFASRLKSSVRSTDFVGRISGDEFVIIIPEINNKIEIEKIVKNILKSCEKPFFIRETSLDISCSIGVAIYPLDGSSSKMLLEEADRRLYEVKNSGRFGYKIKDFID